MSGTGSGVNVEVTADTSDFDAALASASSAAKSAFDTISSVGGAALKDLQRNLEMATVQLEQFESTAGSSTGVMSGYGAALRSYIADLTAQIQAVRDATAATTGLSDANSQGAGITQLAGRALQELINTNLGVTSSFSSARQSASAFTNSLVEQSDAMVALQEEYDALGAGITQLSGKSLQELIDTNLGVTKSFSDARQSASAFTSAMAEQTEAMIALQAEYDALGSGITSLSGRALQELINTNLGVTNSFSSARQSASVFSAELAQLDEALSSLAAGENVAKAGLTDVQLAMAQATGQVREFAGSFVMVEPAMAAATAATDTNTEAVHANTASLREAIVIGHEFMTDRMTRIPGSLMVLAESFGSLGTAMMGWIAIAAVAVFSLTELAEHFLKVQSAVREANAAMAVFDPSVTTDKVSQLTTQLERVPGVTAVIANQSVADMGRMSDVSVQAMQVMINSAQQYAEATGKTVPEALTAMASAYSDPIAKGQQFVQDLHLTGGELASFDGALQTGQPSKVRVQMLEDLARAAEQVRIRNDEATISTLKMDQANSMGGKFAMGKGDGSVIAGGVGAAEADEIQAQKDLQAAIAAVDNQTTQAGEATETWSQKNAEAIAEIDARVTASASNSKQADEDKARADEAYWQGVLKNGNLTTAQIAEAKTALFNAEDQLNMRSLASATATATSTTQAQIAALGAQEAAAHGSADQIEQIEDQKLAILKAAYGEDSRQYQDELAKKTEALRSAGSDEAAVIKQQLANQQTLDTQAAQTYMSSLKEQVDAQQITNTQALTEYRAFVEQQEAAQVESVNNLIATLRTGTEAYADAMKERTALLSDFQKQDAAMDQAIAASASKAAQQQAAYFTSSFAEVGSTARSQLDQIVTLQQSFAGAAEKVYGAVLTSFVNLATQELAKWSATMVAQIALTRSSQMAIAAAQAAGSSGWATIGAALMRYIGLSAAANTTTMTQTSVTSIAQVHSAAAVAAANAFAATAAIPITGPALAPAAAASALAQVDAYAGLASLAVGAWNVPADMPANLHAGEMVVPATFAQGLRSNGQLPGVSGGVTNSFSFSPTVNASGGVSPSELQGMLQNQFQQMLTYMQNAFRNGTLSLPGRA